MKTIFGIFFLITVTIGAHAQWISSGTNIFNSNSGNVGIGSLNPDAKLAVKGIVHAQEVKVDLSVPGPDYVFDKDYPLLPLPSVEEFINQHKHLPDLPTAHEMQNKGIQLGEMNMMLLKKVEELTLYLIELQKEVETLRQYQNLTTHDN